MGCDGRGLAGYEIKREFQSTHPAWGATPTTKRHRIVFDISIHAPRVGCDPVTSSWPASFIYFNPRTPRGVRPRRLISYARTLRFQSTHPAWGATFAKFLRKEFAVISIHAPRVGCDRYILVRKRTAKNFNPRTPRGVRQTARACLGLFFYFNPRTPRGVRLLGRVHLCHGGISIHAPRVGCDVNTDTKTT